MVWPMAEDLEPVEWAAEGNVMPKPILLVLLSVSSGSLDIFYPASSTFRIFVVLSARVLVSP